MSKLVFLGTATNVPDANHENTHMVLAGKNRLVLIDGPANPYSRLLQCGLDVIQLTDVIITHFHPDHVAGIPLLLMALGLSGRKNLLNIYANSHCMSRLENLLNAYEWNMWHDFPVNFHLVPEEKMHLLFHDEEFKVVSSPVKHFIPAIGLRIDILHHGKVMAYSGDTAPTESLYELSKEADILVHEAGGASEGHSSAKQAAALAAQANVKSLYLVHYPVGEFDYSQLAVEAAEIFDGKVIMAEDFDILEFDQL